jgi:CBS domain-containing protein
MKFPHSIAGVLADKGSQVLTISPRSRVFDALVSLAEHDVGALVVVDEGGRPVGMFSERDYARKVILHGKASRQIEVGEVMTFPIQCVTPSQTVEECMRIMTLRRVRHLPVLEDGRLTGIVSIGDMVKSIISAQDDAIHQLENYIAGKYPA